MDKGLSPAFRGQAFLSKSDALSKGGGTVHIVISEYGTSLGKTSERLVIRRKGADPEEHPFVDIDQVTITTSGVSISTDLIRQCADHGIVINFLSSTGDPYAKLLSGALTGTVLTRREQMKAYDDDRGVALAKAFVDGKIHNQGNVLKYFAKHRRTANHESYENLYDVAKKLESFRQELASLQASPIDAARGTMLSLEGRAAQAYWEQVKALLEGKVAFPGREHRGATDPVNAMLNYGYGILYQQVSTALALAGLDPYAGFLHVDRPGKMSLVLDFVEEFRPVTVDRVVVALASKGTLPRMQEGRIIDEDRRALAVAILTRFDDEERHEGRRHKLKTIIQMQARRIATFLRGEARYRAFVAGW